MSKMLKVLPRLDRKGPSVMLIHLRMELRKYSLNCQPNRFATSLTVMLMFKVSFRYAVEFAGSTSRLVGAAWTLGGSNPIGQVNSKADVNMSNAYSRADTLRFRLISPSSPITCISLVFN